MFEIYKRHRPVFAVSEVKRVARLLTESLCFNDVDLSASGVEILDVGQTARINENNQYVVKSRLSHDEVMAVVQKNPTLQKLAAGRRGGPDILHRILGDMIDHLGIDSQLPVGDVPSISPIHPGLKQATASSRKPLLVFNALSGIDYAALDPRWFDADHPAIWLGHDWLPAMDATEAFFAMSPELKLEVALNRYQTLASFGDFAVGMVRL